MQTGSRLKVLDLYINDQIEYGNTGRRFRCLFACKTAMQ